MALLALLFPFLQLGGLKSAAPQSILEEQAQTAETDSAAQARRLKVIANALRNPPQAQLESGAAAHSQALPMDGDGYYLISGAADLAAINNDLSAKYRLTRDISLRNKSFQPIGSVEHPFTGILDGGAEQYAIQSLLLNRSANLAGNDITALGLVAVNAGTIKNIQLQNCAINLTVTTAADADEPAAYAGSVTGYNIGRIENCYVTGSVAITSGTVGEDAFLSCSGGGVAGFQASLTDLDDAGIFNTLSEAIVRVTGTGSYYGYAGGIVGYIWSDSVTSTYAQHIYRCVAKGDASAQSGASAAYAGGLVGVVDGAAEITECAAFGDAAAHSAFSSAFAGGFAGMIASTDLLNCVAFGAAAAESGGATGGLRRVCAGGLVGRMNMSSLKTSYATGIPTATGLPAKYVGGAVGAESTLSSALNCYYLQGTALTGVGSGTLTIDPLSAAELEESINYVGFWFPPFGDIWEIQELEGIGLRAYLTHAPQVPTRSPEPEPKLPILKARQGTGVIVDEKRGLIYGLRDRVIARELISESYAESPDYYLYIENAGYVVPISTDALLSTGYRIRLFAKDGTPMRDYVCVIFGDCTMDGKVDQNDVAMATNLIGSNYISVSGQLPSYRMVALMLSGVPWGAVTSSVPLTIDKYYKGAGSISYGTIATNLYRSFDEYGIS